MSWPFPPICTSSCRLTWCWRIKAICSEQVLSQRFSSDIQRSNLIEFGHLASFTKGTSPTHFYLMAEMLVSMGFEWCIFTATDPLHALMTRMGLEPHAFWPET